MRDLVDERSLPRGFCGVQASEEASDCHSYKNTELLEKTLRLDREARRYGVDLRPLPTGAVDRMSANKPSLDDLAALAHAELTVQTARALWALHSPRPRQAPLR